jgi:diadenosine tetraphosphate (Ap4A) HIT family hydrolase
MMDRLFYQPGDVSVKPCAFCTLPAERIIHTSEHGVVIRDGFPVSPGHTLIIPKRHLDSFFNLSAEEKVDLMALLDTAKEQVEKEFSPTSYNIGINDGPAAGQTIPHLHIHLIPRYTGDVPDPRGGVRWLIPDKADYWSNR